MSTKTVSPPVPSADNQLIESEPRNHEDIPSIPTPTRQVKQPKSILAKTQKKIQGRKTNSGHVVGEGDALEDEDEAEDNDELSDGHSTETLDNEGEDVMIGLNRKRKANAISMLDENEQVRSDVSFPRKKMNRTLSNNGGRLQYNEIEAAALRSLAAEAKAQEDALASESDDEVYKKLDDDANDSDTDSLMQDAEEAMLADSDDDLETVNDGQSQAADDENGSVDGVVDDLQWRTKIDAFFGPSGLFEDDDFEPHMFEHDFLEPPTPRRKSESSERRVRFQDDPVIPSSSSSSSSSDFDVDTFPDLLDSMERDPIVPQESLDHLLLHQIEGQDDDYDLYSAFESDAGSSEYDFGENEAAMHVFRRASKAKANEDDEESSGSESGSLSGYDSDGDTTDDEMPAPQTISRPKTVLHSPPNTQRAKPTPRPFPRNSRGRVVRRGPVMGSFKTDDDKPFAFYDAAAKRLRIVNTPKKKQLLASGQSSVNNSPCVNFPGLEDPSDNDFSQVSSLFPGSLDVMMSGLFGGPPGQRWQNGRLINSATDLYGGNFGAPEAFYAPRLNSVSEEGSDLTTEDEHSSAEEIDVYSEFVDIDKFDFGFTPSGDEDNSDPHDTEPDATPGATQNSDPSSSAEDDTENPDMSAAEQTPSVRRTSTTSIPNTPSATTPLSAAVVAGRRARNLSNSMLAHFDRASVTAFKNNQDKFRMLQRLPADPGSMPLKAGKTASDVMTPPRRRKAIRRGMGMVGKRPVN